MDAVSKLNDMIAAEQQKIQDLNDVLSEFQSLQSSGSGNADLQSQLDKAKSDAQAIVAERDALRAAIQAEIDDKKKDTSRLEAAIGDVEEAPAPVIPDAPAPAADPSAAPASSDASAAPAADPSAAPAAADPSAAPAAPAVDPNAPTPGPTASI